MSEGGGWRLERLGAWTQPQTYEVTAEHTIAYAQATNDDHPAHLSGELAPPCFAVVPVFEAIVGQVLGIVPGEHAMRVVHGEHDMRVSQPIVPGQTLLSRAAAVGVHGRSGCVVVVGRAQTTTSDGSPVSDQYMTSLLRGAQLGSCEGDEPAEHAFDEALRAQAPLATVEHAFDADQPRRYSQAAGDPMPIHLDDDFARAMGLPGVVVHGLCTMAFCSRAVIATACPEDPARLRRLAVRFAEVVQPSETVTHTLWDAGAGRIAFETVSSSGSLAIQDGLAEVA